MKISEDVGSKYRFIILAGQRVAQLQRGAKPRVETPETVKFTRVAIDELSHHKLNFNKIGTVKEKPAPDPEPVIEPDTAAVTEPETKENAEEK